MRTARAHRRCRRSRLRCETDAWARPFCGLRERSWRLQSNIHACMYESLPAEERPTAPRPGSPPRSRQADRSARTRGALLESAARGLSRCGYGNLVLEQVASEAGYTRGALYHQFKDKEDLALAVIDWVDETWQQEVGRLMEQESDPVLGLIALARGHAVYCRRD